MKILLYTPWFGKLPNYFNTWVKSIEHLEGVVDFVFITDCATEITPPSCLGEVSIPKNLLVKNVSFETLQERFKDVFGNKNVPMHSYKLCDYKPVYHKAFPEFLTDEYEYWGYCDIDTVFGDVRGFLERINYVQYDRIGYLGHFTIYRNSVELRDIHNTIILADKDPYHRFEYLGTTTYPCHFDEEGMNLICDQLSLNFYKKPLVFNTIEKHLHIHTSYYKDSYELLTWEGGHTYRYHLDNQNGVVKEEAMYIHYGVQKDMPQLDELGDNFFLTSRGFKHFESQKLMTYLKKYGRPDTPEEQDEISNMYKAMLRKRRKDRLKMEYQHFGIIGLMKNVYYRLHRLYDVIFKYHNL